MDRHGTPVGAATDGAGVHEVNLAPGGLADIPPGLPMPWPVPVLADRAYDSDPLREALALDGFELVARRRANRTRPATADGRVLRRLSRRWVVERTIAWLKSFRRVATRYERLPHLYDGVVSLACAFIALNRLL